MVFFGDHRLVGILTVVLGVEAAVLNDVLEGVVHEAALAALVALGLGAVHQLLLGEAVLAARERARGNGDAALGGARGRERPARPALAWTCKSGAQIRITMHQSASETHGHQEKRATHGAWGQGAERPPTENKAENPVQKKNIGVLPWFLTLVTAPLVRQSTASAVPLSDMRVGRILTLDSLLRSGIFAPTEKALNSSLQFIGINM